MLSVQIPGGIESGMRLRLANEGEHGVQGGPQGDLYVAVTVKPHPIFAAKARISPAIFPSISSLPS